MTKKPTQTPLMQQYHEIKAAYADMIVLFQVGDFYELFFDDARRAAPILGVALTSRGMHDGQPIALCGIPLHVCQHYVPKLLAAGFKVAICEQLEPPAPGRVVKRGVTRVLTPGMLTDDGLVQAHRPQILASVVGDAQVAIVVAAELLRGAVTVTVLQPATIKAIETEFQALLPQEVLVDASFYSTIVPVINAIGSSASIVEKPLLSDAVLAWVTTRLEPGEQLQELALQALAQLHEYLSRYMPAALESLQTINLINRQQYVVLDAATQRNLDLVVNSEGTRQHTLFDLLDECSTAMGSRLLRNWILYPLASADRINERFAAVELLTRNVRLHSSLREYLLQIGDVERVLGRLRLGSATLQDVVQLRRCLQVLPHIRVMLDNALSVGIFAQLAGLMHDFTYLAAYLQKAIQPEPTPQRIIAQGFNDQLDAARSLVEHVNDEILRFEQAEQQATGIPTLKVRPQTAHGYTIEITAQYKSKVPPHYRAIQTLTGRERYTMPALQELEARITQAERDLSSLQQKLYQEVLQRIIDQISPLRATINVLCQLDVLSALAEAAYQRGYTKPVVTAERKLVITAGKHPVAAKLLGSSFVPNSTSLSADERTWLITGANMGGKSTYLRQVALIALMAHIGSFVPASAASIPLIDRIFTRVGAGDRLAEGKSTFLVEMEETAAICRHATSKSLVILDEVGRGTSTRDGLAIAQAVVEHLHDSIGCMTLFATHYHELTSLEGNGISCYHMACRSTAQGIVFLHTLVPGAAQQSFGIEVAERAELPKSVVDRARALLGVTHHPMASVQVAEVTKSPESEILGSLARLSLDDISPRQAVDILWQLQQQLKEGV